MTEQPETRLDEETEAYCRMVEEVVRENFTALDTAESFAAGGSGSQRDMVESDLKEYMDLDELERAFRQGDTLLKGVWFIAEAFSNAVFMMVVSDARERARTALRRIEEFRATS